MPQSHSDNCIEVFIRNVYGRPSVYPANGLAAKFAELLGVKTFTKMQLDRITALGYSIEHVADSALKAALL